MKDKDVGRQNDSSLPTEFRDDGGYPSQKEREFERQLDDLFSEEKLLRILEEKVDRLESEERLAAKSAWHRSARFRWGLAGAAAACLLLIILTIGIAESEFRTAGDSVGALAMTDTTAKPRLISMADKDNLSFPVQDALKSPNPEAGVESVSLTSVNSQSSGKYSGNSKMKVIQVEDETAKFLRMLGEVDMSMPSDIVRKISSSDYYLMPTADEISAKINEMNYPREDIVTDATSIMEQAIINIRNI